MANCPLEFVGNQSHVKVVLECVFEVQEKAYDSPFLLWNGNVGLQRRIVRLRQTDIDGLSHWLQTRLEVDEVEGEFVAY